MESFKIIIAGGRDFIPADRHWNKLIELIEQHAPYPRPIEIVSGGARGADRYGEIFAGTNKLKLTKFPAKWNEYGKSAGYKRNKQMAEYADMLIAIWDGSSRGTKHMIDLATERGLIVEIIPY